MIKKFFLPVVAVLFLFVGAGCARQNTAQAPAIPAPAPAPAPVPAPATRPTSPTPNVPTNPQTQAWPAPGNWATLKVTTSRGTVASVTRAATAFTVAGQEYEGMEMITSTNSYGGRTGTVAIFWKKGDRFGESTRYVASLPIPGSTQLTCVTTPAEGSNMNTAQTFTNQYYQNQQNVGPETLTLSNGLTIETTHYRTTVAGETSDTWISPGIPFLVVKAVGAGTTSEEVANGATWENKFTGEQLVGACANSGRNGGANNFDVNSLLNGRQR